MLLSRFAVGIFSAGLIVLGAGTVSGQDFPSKPGRLLPGGTGGPDFEARLIAPGIAGPLGQPVIVENRPVTLAIESVMKAPPDGYNLLVVSAVFLVSPLLQEMRYDPVNDFSPITMLSREASILIVHPSLPVKSVKELIALAKAKPGALNYASGPTGGGTHLSAELFKSMAGVNIVRIPYKGGGLAAIDVVGGHVEMMFASPGTGTPHVKSGRVRALAVTGTKRSALLPDVPTVAASGLPGYEYVGLDAVYAPAKTPAAIINRLNQEIVRFLGTAEARQKALAGGIEIVASPPEELTAVIKSDMAKISQVIKSAGIKAD